MLCKCHLDAFCSQCLVCMSLVVFVLWRRPLTEMAVFTVQVTVRPWPKTLYETDASGAIMPRTCYYYVGMKKKQVSSPLTPAGP